MAVPPVGARAYFLLGMLIGNTRRVDELEALLNEALSRPELLDWLDDVPFSHGSPGLSLRSLADAGQEELRRLLLVLEEAGLTSHVTVSGEELWTACRIG
jgi:DNA-binding transcriptional ArsR family regulator